MNQEKKEYLSCYILQHAKINRFNQLLLTDPKRKEFYLKEIENSMNLRKEIEEKINNVDGKILSEILFQKYICGRTLYEISLILHYSQRQIERLHIKALKNFKM